MPSRRSTETVSLPESMKHLFRGDSGARIVAERLLTGRAQTRTALVDGTGVASTTVPRVVDRLKSVGVDIERTTDRSRQAVYRVVNMSQPELEDPKHGSVMVEFTQVSGDPVSVAVSKVEMRDGSAHIEVTLGGRKCSGRVLDSKSLVIPPSLFTGTADLVGVALLSDGAIAYRVGDMRQSVLIGDIADL
jgi:biotin operon repressor